jgi:filamentous hemagglutinin
VSAGVAEELNGRAPTDPGAQWINTGLTNANGNPLIVQSLPAPNQALPVGTDIRGTVASVAGGVSTAAGQFSAATIAAAQIPSPYAPGLTAASYAGTAIGMAADGVAQIAKPNVGQYWENGLTSMVSDRSSLINPLAAPIVNEVANLFNASGTAVAIQDTINSYLISLLRDQ